MLSFQLHVDKIICIYKQYIDLRAHRNIEGNTFVRGNFHQSIYELHIVVTNSTFRFLGTFSLMKTTKQTGQRCHILNIVDWKRYRTNSQLLERNRKRFFLINLSLFLLYYREYLYCHEYKGLYINNLLFRNTKKLHHISLIKIMYNELWILKCYSYVCCFIGIKVMFRSDCWKCTLL